MRDFANNGPLLEEISRRPFPKALRPIHVYRADGASRAYAKWMMSPDTTPIVGMLFEDGHEVWASEDARLSATTNREAMQVAKERLQDEQWAQPLSTVA